MLVDGPDCRLWIEVRGEGRPVTVFAHGISSSIEEVEPFSTATPGTRVLYDLRGHGRSDRPIDGYGYGASARDLDFVVREFGATQAFGVSLSAESILMLMARDPRRFERAVLFIPGALDAPNAGAGHFPDVAADLEGMTLEDNVAKALADPVYGLLFAKRPQWRRLVAQRILRMNRDGVPRSLRAYAGLAEGPLPDPSPLEKVEAPVLVLAHEDDPVHDVAVARRIASVLPNATLRIWEEPLAMLDDPAAFAALVGAFLAAPVS